MEKFRKKYSKENKEEALKWLDRNLLNGKPDYRTATKKLGISVDTLKRWWLEYKLKQSDALKAKLEEAISSILARIKMLSNESSKISELAPVVKMLSEILQQIEQDNVYEVF